MPGQPMGERTDQHLARLAHRLQSLRSVHRVAGHRIGFGAACAKSASHDRPRIDADVEHQRRAGISCRALAHARRPRDHLEGRAERPLGIVFMCNRRSEQGKQGIADEFVDETAPVLDCGRQLLEQLVLQRPHQFRVKAFAQCGEAAEIRKQHGDGAAIGFGVRPGRMGGTVGLALAAASRQHDQRRLRSSAGRRIDLSAASWTKREIRGARITAAGAKIRLLRSAFGAEGKAALDFETAATAVHRSRPARDHVDATCRRA